MLNESKPEIHKRSHCERWWSNLPKVEFENYQTTSEFASIQPQESINQAWMKRIDGEKVFGWRFSSKISKLQCKSYYPFFENGAWSEFGRWRELRNFLAKWVWLSKAYDLNEMRSLFIEFRIRISGNLVIDSWSQI